MTSNGQCQLEKGDPALSPSKYEPQSTSAAPDPVYEKEAAGMEQRNTRGSTNAAVGESPHDAGANLPTYPSQQDIESMRGPPSLGKNENENDNDVFGNEEGNEIKYRTVGWKMIAFLMISEVVSNGVLALPSSAAVVGVRSLS